MNVGNDRERADITDSAKGVSNFVDDWSIGPWVIMVCLPLFAAPNLIHDLDQALGQQINLSLHLLPPDNYLRMKEPPVLHFSTVLVQCYPHFISRTGDWCVHRHPCFFSRFIYCRSQVCLGTIAETPAGSGTAV